MGVGAGRKRRDGFEAQHSRRGAIPLSTILIPWTPVGTAAIFAGSERDNGIFHVSSARRKLRYSLDIYSPHDCLRRNHSRSPCDDHYIQFHIPLPSICRDYKALWAMTLCGTV